MESIYIKGQDPFLNMIPVFIFVLLQTFGVIVHVKYI